LVCSFFAIVSKLCPEFKTFIAERSRDGHKCAYLCVVEIFRCPANAATVYRSTPLCTSWEANVCL